MDEEICSNLSNTFTYCPYFNVLSTWIQSGKEEKMFTLTENAYKILKVAVLKEQQENEKLFVRLSMGIG